MAEREALRGQAAWAGGYKASFPFALHGPAQPAHRPALGLEGGGMAASIPSLHWPPIPLLPTSLLRSPVTPL